MCPSGWLENIWAVIKCLAGAHTLEKMEMGERERQRANCLLYFYSDLEAFYPIITDNPRLRIVACKTFMVVTCGRVCSSKQNIKKCGVLVPFICVFTPVLVKCVLNCTPLKIPSTCSISLWGSDQSFSSIFLLGNYLPTEPLTAVWLVR